MTGDSLEIRPNIEREPVHETITREQVSDLVDQFYGKVQKNQRLGPIFAARIQDDWQPHLDKMKGFWRSVLLKTGEYKGRPLPVHFEIRDQAIPDDYGVWLKLFRETAREVFQPQAAEIVITTAERIAHSFWLGIYAGPMEKNPDWLKE